MNKCKMLSLWIILLAVGAASIGHAELIGYWPLDGNTLDRSGNEYHGTVSKKKLTYVPGRVGLAAKFADDVASKDDMASVINCGDVPLGSELTVAVWIKPSDIAQDFQGYVQKQNTEYTERAFWMGQSVADGTFQWAFFSPPTAPGQPLHTPNALKNNVWVHLAITMDKEEDGFYYQKTYVNGVLKKTGKAKTSGIVDGGNNLRFGRVENTAGGHFSGLMDDVQIYDHALSQAEIKNIMNGLTIDVASEVGSSAKPDATGLPVKAGLLLDLNANVDVDVEDGNRVKSWRNQIIGNKADVFVKRDKGRKEPGSGRPTLKKSQPSIGGQSTIVFREQELLNMDEDVFDHLLTGNGYTWLSVMSVYKQIKGKKDVNSFFGNLKNGSNYEGFWACLTDDNRVWMGNRNGESKGMKDLKSNPMLIAPEALKENQFYVVMGRMGAGKGMVDLELFINTVQPIISAKYPVNPKANSSMMAIGQERDATNHPGKESFSGEIARFLIFERPLSDDELTAMVQHLVKLYGINIVN